MNKNECMYQATITKSKWSHNTKTLGQKIVHIKNAQNTVVL